MLTLENIPGIFCDALVDDDEFLVFASFWGRDTAIQELLARLSMSSTEGGLNQLEFGSSADKTRTLIRIGHPDRLDKLTGRMPKKNIFGDIVQVWLFDKKIRTPDRVNRQAYLLLQRGQDDQIALAWRVIKNVCHLPLLDHWQAAIMKLMREHRWLKMVEGYGGLNLISLTTPEEAFNQEICQMINDGQLTTQLLSGLSLNDGMEASL